MWCLMVLGLGPWHGMTCSQNEVNVPLLLHEQDDTLLWKLHDGILKSFSVRDAWQTVRDRGEEVEWSYLVWSRYWIPRHAIHLWLVMRRRLKTQDGLRQWDVDNDVDLKLLVSTMQGSTRFSLSLVF